MGVGMEADLLSQSKREARARRDFPTLEPAESSRWFYLHPKRSWDRLSSLSAEDIIATC